MNGRVYDPLVARFMSPDPFIQDPEHSQSYNRYTYVWNNPTNLTDPTGFVANGYTSQYADNEGNCDKRCQQLQHDLNNEADKNPYGSWSVGNSSENSPSNSAQNKDPQAPTTQQIDAAVLKTYWRETESPSIVRDLYDTLQAKKLIKIEKINGVLVLSAQVTINGYIKDQIANELNSALGNLTLSDAKGVMKTNIKVTPIDDGIKADIKVNQIKTPGGRSNGMYGVININTGDGNNQRGPNNDRLDPGTVVHEFGHAFFGYHNFYYESPPPIKMDNGYVLKSFSHYGFQDSFMGSCMTCPLKASELRDTIDYFSKQKK